MSDPRTGALILAAGKGTRMHGEAPKVLRRVLEEPMLRYVYRALAPLFSNEATWAVIGHQAQMVKDAFAGEERRFILQEKQLGTGHALCEAWPELERADLTHVLVVNGDTPLLTTSALNSLMKESETAGADLAFATLTLPDPEKFGRVVRKNGRVAAIIEAKDYDPARHGPEPKEINAGIYLLRMASMAPLLEGLTNANKSGEYYITDLVGLAVARRLTVIGRNFGDDPQLLGINTPVELTRSEELIRERIVEDFQRAGVLIRAAGSVRIGPDVRIASGAEITGPCEFYGATRIGAGAIIASHCRLENTTVDQGAVIHSFTHASGAHVGPSCTVGPFARLRPGAVLEEGAHVGNYVEVKKSRLGKGAKANHLTYIGDAEIGAAANIGAGTITCNYDGKNKHLTRIGEGAFIGSNSALVAPVNVGKNALVGAGSVITKDVPDGQLAVARGKQANMPRKK